MFSAFKDKRVVILSIALVGAVGLGLIMFWPSMESATTGGGPLSLLSRSSSNNADTVGGVGVEQLLQKNQPINASTLNGHPGLYYLDAKNLTGIISPEHFSAYDSLVREGKIPEDSVITTGGSSQSQSQSGSNNSAQSPQQAQALAQLKAELLANRVSSITAGLGLQGGGQGDVKLDVVVGQGIVLQNGKLTAILGDNINLMTEVAGILSVAHGGTGLNSAPASNQFLIGQGGGYGYGQLKAGDGLNLNIAGGEFTFSVDSTVCRTAGNCAGSGGGLVGAGGAGQVAFFTDASTINGDTGLLWNSTDKILSLGSTDVSDQYLVNGQPLSTSHVLEGTNLYFSVSRFNAAFGDMSTDDLAEGTQKYWSQTLFDDALSSASLNASAISGTLSIAHGGTGATTAQAAINALSGLATSGDLLTHNGTNAIRLARGTAGQCLTSTASGVAWGSCLTGNSITGSGATGQLAFFDSSSSLSGESALTWDATNKVLSLAGDISITGSILPTTDDTYALGSPSLQWKDVYIGPGSLYINGQKVLGDSGDSIKVTADDDQNLILQSSGAGDLELATLGSGAIQVKGNILLADGKTIRSINSSPINFSDGIQAGALRISGNSITAVNTNSDIQFTPNGTGSSYFSSGNVGIGTSSPSTKLDVNGSFRASGQATLSQYAANGGLLLTNGSGVVQQTAIGTAGQCLQSAGGGTPTWAACGPSIPANNLTGSGTAGQISFYNGANTLTGGNNLSWDAANSRLGVGVGLTPAATLDVASTGTTANAAQIKANSLTTGYGLRMSSTSNALTTGGLISLDWSPTAATTMTGDLLSVNVGPNGSVGSLMNLTQDGLSVFKVSPTQIVANVPVSFRAAGNMSVAYDLVFTNSTVANIESAGPLRLQAGEVFNSSDLTLGTYNNGAVVFDSKVVTTANGTKLGLGVYNPTARLSLAEGLTAADGIAFGDDVTLYRSAANTLKSDGLVAVGGLQIGDGAVLQALYSQTNTWDPASLNTGESASTTLTVTGAALGNVVTASFTQELPDKVVLTGQVTAAGTVKVTLVNLSDDPVDLAEGTVRVQVNKF